MVAATKSQIKIETHLAVTGPCQLRDGAAQLARPHIFFLHRLLPPRSFRLDLLLKYLQITSNRTGQFLIIPAAGLIDIPFNFPIVFPKVREDPISEIRIAGVLFPKQI